MSSPRTQGTFHVEAERWLLAWARNADGDLRSATRSVKERLCDTREHRLDACRRLRERSVEQKVSTKVELLLSQRKRACDLDECTRYPERQIVEGQRPVPQREPSFET